MYDQLFVKEPGTAAGTPWHNDTSYWHIDGQQVCSVWVSGPRRAAPLALRIVFIAYPIMYLRCHSNPELAAVQRPWFVSRRWQHKHIFRGFLVLRLQRKSLAEG